MKLAALILLLAIVGKISAHPHRVGYYRAAGPPPQQISSDEMDDEVADDDDDAEAEVSSEDNFQEVQDDDDDDDDDQEPPPNFQKLFPLASPRQPGYNYQLSSMMSEIGGQAWKVPKKGPNRGRHAIAYRMDSEEDDEPQDDDDSDEDDSDEEEDEESDDLPDWQGLFPNPSAQGQGPPSDVIDQSTQPEVGAFRSGHPGARVVYVPANELRGMQGRAVYATPTQYVAHQGAGQRRQYHQGQQYQYVMRQPSPPRAPIAYSYVPAYGNHRNPAMHRRPQTVMMASPSMRRPQQQQQLAYTYMPVRRNSYNPYVARWRRNSAPRISY